MADVVDKKPTALENQGVGEGDQDPAISAEGNRVPDAAPNKAPEVIPTPEEKAAQEKAEADAKAKADADEKAKAEAEDKEKAGDNKPLDTDVWGTTGDEVGDSVLELLQNSGLEVDEAKSLMFDAIQAGDVTKVDQAALIEKVGKAKATLIMAGARDFVATSKAKAETILNEVHTTVGGKDNWEAVTTWAKDNVSDGDLGEYRTMIDNGGAQARFAASELAAKYNAADANTTLDTTATAEITPDAAAPSTARATTRATYVVELGKAYDTGASQAVINEIKQARSRGRAQGM